ncbi:MAG TPA: XdhC family protein [Anaerolineae bacterium]
MTSIYHAILDAQAKGRPAALCTVIRARGSVPRHAGSKMLVYADGQTVGTIGGGELENRIVAIARQAVQDGQPRIEHHELSDPSQGDPGVCGGEMDIFIEPIKPEPVVLVIGGGHIGRAIVHLAKWLGFRVALSDDRPEYCTPEWAPGADEYLPVPMSELPGRFSFHTETYIVMPTRGVSIDVDGLPHLLDQPHAYLGVIGSRRRWAAAVKELGERGVPEAQLSRVHSPMGLELNAETPEEIAVSIMAEIIMLRRGGTGETMKKLSVSSSQ